MVARLAVNLGQQSFVNTREDFDRIVGLNTMPIAHSNQLFTVMVQDDVIETSEEATPVIYENEAREHDSYAVSGWFKWVTPESR
jgi:hypothetical protein